MVELDLKTELDERFPRIKADTLPPPQKIVELRRKLQDSPQWKLFKNRSDDARTIRLNLSNLTEKVKPLIHGILEDEDFDYDTDSFKGMSTNQKPIIKGIALHEALSLWDLWRFGKTGFEEIDRSFPTNKDDQELILPFINVLKKDGRSAEEIWGDFHTDRRLVDRSKYLLSQEFGILPLSIKKQEELKIRASDEVHEAGLLMARNLSTEVEPDLKHYCETLAIFNFKELSPYGKSRIQIPVRFDRVISEKFDSKHFKYNFFDLKTG